MRRRLCIAAGWIVTGATLTAIAQQQPSPVPGTFRSSVTLVPVDMRVLGRDGDASVLYRRGYYARAQLVAGPGRGGEVIGDATIDIAPLMLEVLEDGRRHGEIDVAFFCHDADGISVGERWGKLTLVLTPEEYQRARRDGVTHTMSIPVKSSPRTVKVVVYDYLGDVIGSADRRLF